jgi:hypothetical protein
MKKAILILILLFITGCTQENVGDYKKIKFVCPSLNEKTIKDASNNLLLTTEGDLYYFQQKYENDSWNNLSLFSDDSNCIRINGDVKIDDIKYSQYDSKYLLIDSNNNFYAPIVEKNILTGIEEVLLNRELVYEFNFEKYQFHYKADEDIKLLNFLLENEIITYETIYSTYDQSKRIFYIKDNNIYRAVVKNDGDYFGNLELENMQLVSNDLYYKLEADLKENEQVIDMYRISQDIFYIKTNLGYYSFNKKYNINKEECTKYADVDCEFEQKLTKIKYATDNYDSITFFSNKITISNKGEILTKQ